MSQLSDLQSDVAEFLDYDVEGSFETTLRLINRAIRYINDAYSGKWNHLHRYDVSASIDTTGYLVDLPSDFNVMDVVTRSKLKAYPFVKNRDYEMVVSSPTNLQTAPTRQIKFYLKQTTNGTVYLNYWRKLKEFASGDLYLDMPTSYSAILETSKWLGMSNFPDRYGISVRAEQRNAMMDEIGTLYDNDTGDDFDKFAPIADFDKDGYHADTGYNLSDGGGRDTDTRGPIMDRNYGG